LEKAPEDSNLKLGQKVSDLHDPVARQNFRVVVIRPEEVERLDLTDYEKGQRWKWTWVPKDGDNSGGKGAWYEVQAWP
jgi:pyridoxamine 5'-phosphate oxidase